MVTYLYHICRRLLVYIAKNSMVMCTAQIENESKYSIKWPYMLCDTENIIVYTS